MAGTRVASARERLLEATAELIYDGGIEATGVDAIARSAGVTKRTLYQHFGSKDELVGAALAAKDAGAITALRSAVERRIAKRERPVAALFAVLRRVFSQGGYEGCAFLNAGLEMHNPEHPVRRAVRSHTDARRALVADLVRAEGIDDEATIDAISFIAEGAFALSASRRDPSVAARAASAARVVMDAYRDDRDDWHAGS